MASVIAIGQQRALDAEALDGGDVVAQPRLALADDDDREGGQVHHQVDAQVEDGRLHAEARGDDDAREHVARLRDRGPRHQALERALAQRADVAHDDRDGGQHGERGRPVGAGVEQRDVEEAQEGAEGGRLGRHGHEGGDRRRGALVDVGRPLVEGRHRGLEGQADHAQRDARSAAASRSSGRPRRARCPRSRSTPSRRR